MAKSAICHGQNTDDGEFAPPLKGTAFLQKYAGKPVGELTKYMNSRMPPASPGTLGAFRYTQIAAFILQQNGVLAGPAELPSDAPRLSGLLFPGGGSPAGRGGRGPGAGPSGGLTPGVTLPPAPVKANPLDRITPVSDAMLQNPPAGDWLTWRRGFDYQGFSPLKQITKSNVNNLRVAWTWTLLQAPTKSLRWSTMRVMLAHGFGDNDSGAGRRHRRPALAVEPAGPP